MRPRYRRLTREPGTGPLGPLCPRLGLLSELEHDAGFGKKWLPDIKQTVQKKVQQTAWDLFIASIKRRLGL